VVFLFVSMESCAGANVGVMGDMGGGTGEDGREFMFVVMVSAGAMFSAECAGPAAGMKSRGRRVAEPAPICGGCVRRFWGPGARRCEAWCVGGAG
jgi:hypothetical protein